MLLQSRTPEQAREVPRSVRGSSVRISFWVAKAVVGSSGGVGVSRIFLGINIFSFFFFIFSSTAPRFRASLRTRLGGAVRRVRVGLP